MVDLYNSTTYAKRVGAHSRSRGIYDTYKTDHTPETHLHTLIHGSNSHRLQSHSSQVTRLTQLSHLSRTQVSLVAGVCVVYTETTRYRRVTLKSAAPRARAGAQLRDSRRCACRFASASLVPPARARGAASARARALRPEGLRQRCRRCARWVVPRRGLIQRRRHRYSRRGSPDIRL